MWPVCGQHRKMDQYRRARFIKHICCPLFILLLDDDFDDTQDTTSFTLLGLSYRKAHTALFVIDCNYERDLHFQLVRRLQKVKCPIYEVFPYLHKSSNIYIKFENNFQTSIFKSCCLFY